MTLISCSGIFHYHSMVRYIIYVKERAIQLVAFFYNYHA